MSIPRIQTARLNMRAFSPQDLDHLAEILAKPEVMRYMPGGQPLSRQRAAKHLESITRHWEQHGYGWWAIMHQADARLIGWCGLTYLDELDEVEVAYLFDQPYWSQGIGSEAAHASLRYGFEELELEQIIALAHLENIGSQRVMEKNGMQRERELHLWGLDLVQYNLVREDFRPNQKPYEIVRDSAE